MTTKPRILILHVSGTNRDRDVAEALKLAGGAPEIVHVNQLRAGERSWADYQMLVLPGGFAYGDALGAGRLTALDLSVYFAEEVRAFVDAGKPVIGICNGFQALVKAGILPGDQQATLARNARGHFECRWVTLWPNPDSACLFTRGLSEPITCPVAHGEGNFIPCDDGALSDLKAKGQIALTYGESIANYKLQITNYPINPNGSVADIAGVCNARGNVLGLMPHPENHIYAWQHPRWTRGERGGLGLALFENAIRQI
jgi:phosphoribosylformylglycinamidine synthase